MAYLILPDDNNTNKNKGCDGEDFTDKAKNATDETKEKAEKGWEEVKEEADDLKSDLRDDEDK